MSEHQDLVTLIQRRLEQGEVELPVFDNIATRLDQGVRENKMDVASMCEILEEDPVLVSELLKVANSPHFAGLSPIAGLREAFVRLGMRQISSIVFSVSQKRMYSASKGLFRTRLNDLWTHVSAVSLGSRWVAANTGHRQLADEAFVTGLLHDVGKLSILCIIEQISIDNGSDYSTDTIDFALDGLYCSHGSELVKKWNMPENFQTIVESQNDETVDEHNIILSIIRLVNRACIILGISDTRHKPELSSNVEAELLSMPESDIIGLTDADISELVMVLCEMAEKSAQAA